jgi:hypothetical protein
MAGRPCVIWLNPRNSFPSAPSRWTWEVRNCAGRASGYACTDSRFRFWRRGRSGCIRPSLLRGDRARAFHLRGRHQHRSGERDSMSLLISEQNNTVTSESMRELSDEPLVSAARSGDRRAFVELCERHSKKILSRVYRITKNWEDAEDVLQDSILRAFVHLEIFEGRSTCAVGRNSLHASKPRRSGCCECWDVPVNVFTVTAPQQARGASAL